MREATIQKIAVAVGSLLLFSAAALLVFGVSHQTRVAQGHALVISPQVLTTTTPTKSATATRSPAATDQPAPQKPATGTKSPAPITRRETPERETVTTAPRDSEDSESDSSAKPESSKNEYDGEDGATQSNKAPNTSESNNRNEDESQEESQ